MLVQLEIPISTITLFSMLVLGLSLFRISLKTRWPLVLLASFFLSSMSFLVSTLQLKAIIPMLMIVMQAVLIHYIFRLRKFLSLMVAFLGSLGYTIYLAIMYFLMILFTEDSLNDYFYELNLSAYAVKIVAACFSCLTGYIIVKKRLGFTVQMKLSGKYLRQSQSKSLFIIFLVAFILFSSAYYAVTLHIAAIFYSAASFCLFLAWIIYLLYKKEMEES
ncbi:hypothetical protein GK047_16220 [Paenibacillus sp. SYP-B3998]|uniref:Uncharacterized protein n=1 Tax=Paenibacillus sp. SYP-B3998 TaxID=2678564 RepID=A0A6G3ZZB6_9BACL|nr:hypothetical protein [Paenibacillus sp. SYP-B3998]NEW07553.1 hypothetical protein [Paenibacillus sp. SYP-B3998]